MTAKKIKTIAVEKGDYKIFLKKARDLYNIMISARNASNWTAVGLNAVHCAISSCDAVLTFHLGMRSAGEDHIQAADLLLKLPGEDIKSEASTFKRIIAKKNLIAYENREFREVEALDILKLAERFFNWAVAGLPEL